MTIERIDLAQQLPRIYSEQLQEALRTGGIEAFIDELSTRWNIAMQEIEERLNVTISERINRLIEYTDGDFAYFGNLDIDGNWSEGTYRFYYDTDEGELQLQRYLSSTWTNVHRFKRS